MELYNAFSSYFKELCIQFSIWFFFFFFLQSYITNRLLLFLFCLFLQIQGFFFLTLDQCFINSLVVQTLYFLNPGQAG